MNLFDELKRRNVFRVAVAYLIVGWLVIEVVDTIAPRLGLPEWVPTFFILLVLAGLPLAVILSWAFEMTPEGIKRSSEVSPEASITSSTGQKINILIIVALIGVILFQRFAPPLDELTSFGGGDKPQPDIAMAVLPFADLSPAGDQAYLGNGIAEEILNVLASIDGLDVTSRTSAFSLSLQNLSIPEIADRLDVSHVVEGSIRKQDQRVRITAQLIEVESDTHLWSDTFDGDLTDIFKLQDDIAGQISQALSARLEVQLPEASLERPAVDVAAYELYLRARELVITRETEDLRQAMELLQAATTLEPDYADAWAELGAAATLLAFQIFDNGLDLSLTATMETAHDAIEKVSRLDPDHSLGLAVRGLLHMITGDYLEARILLDRATAQPNAGYSAWLWSGVLYSETGFFDKAIETFRAGLEFHPNDPNLERWVASVYHYMGRIDEAQATYEDVTTLGNFGLENSLAVLSFLRGETDLQALLAVYEDAPELEGALDLSEENLDPETLTLIDQGENMPAETLDAYFARNRDDLVRHLTPRLFQRALYRVMENYPTDAIKTLWLAQFWGDEAAQVRSSDEFHGFVEAMKLPQLWRLYGWPQYCAPDQSERGFTCQ